MRPILDKNGALRGIMEELPPYVHDKTYSEQLQDEIEPIDRMIDEGGPVYVERRDFTEGINSKRLEDNRQDLEAVDARQFVQAVADSMLPARHPIYDCKFWIHEEKRLVPYEEYKAFYKRQEDDSDKES